MSLDYIDDKNIAGTAAGSILGDIKNGIVSVGADVASSLYNSTVGLFTDHIETRDILRRADKNALSFYEEHTEGVEAASFLAGIVAPQAVTLKLLGMLKNGAATLGKTNAMTDAVLNTFSGARSTRYETELKNLFEVAKHDTPVYNNTMRRLYANKIAENAIDAAIFEGVTLATLNAHPYMEEYMETPYSNFFLWAGIGTGVGGVLGAISANRAVREATAPIATKGQKIISEAIEVDNPAFANADNIMTHNASIRNLNAIVQGAENPFTKQLAEAALLDVRNKREEAILEAAPWLKNVSKDKKSEYSELRPFVEQLLSDPRLIGVDKVRLPKLTFVPKEKGKVLSFDLDLIRPDKNKLENTITELTEKADDLTRRIASAEGGYTKPVLEEQRVKLQKQIDDIQKELNKTKTVFYRPSTGELFDRNLAGGAARAADIPDFKIAPKTINHQNPGADFSLNNLARAEPSALVDAQYLNELAAVERIKPKDMIHTSVAPDNLARQNAFVYWLSKQSKEINETIAINLRSDLPSYQQTQKFIQSGAAGVKPTHIEDLGKIFNDTKYHIMDNLGRSEASGMLASWKSGDTSTLGRAFDAFFRGRTLPAKEAGNERIAEQIWKAGERTRAELRHYADSEGMIRLYRGVHGPLKGHSPIEGYTLNPRVAKGFGEARLFKVPVDNVVGRIGGSSYASEGEILVSSPHHLIAKDGLDIATETATNIAVHVPNAASVNQVNGLQLVEHYTKETERQVRQMMQDGSFAVEEVSARLNITTEAALLVAAGRNLDEIPKWRRYDDADLIQSEYLSKKHRILALQGDKHTADSAIVAANLDARMLSTAQQQFVEFTTAKHKSSLADDILNLYSPAEDAEVRVTMMQQLDYLKQSLGEVNNQLVGNPFVQSLDNALRNIATGPLVTYLGKQITSIQDKAIKRVLEPVAAAFKGLESKSAIVEFNITRNKINALEGWKDFRVDADTGYGYVVQREMQHATQNGKQVLQQVEVPVKNVDGSVFYVKQEEVINAIEATRGASAELFRLHNLNRELRAQAPLSDVGLYLPPPNLVGKHVSYVVDSTGKARTSILSATTAEELAGLEAEFKSQVISKNPTLKLITKGQQEEFNRVAGYMDGELFITSANNQLRHAGSSASAIIPADARFIDEIMQGYEHQILSGMRKYHEIYLHDVMSKLDTFSKYNQRFHEDQPVRGFFKTKATDAAQTVKNGILGVSNLNQFTTWKTANEAVDMLIVNTGRAIDKVINTFKTDAGSFEHYESLVKELVDRGIKSPWDGYGMYAQSLLGAPAINSKRVVSAGNGLLGTFQLRFLEIAHPLVNALSLPILSSGALMEGLPSTELPNGAKIKFPMRIMMDAMRFQFNPKGIEMIKQWEKEGLNDLIVRQYSDIVGKTHVPTASKGVINETLGAIEAFQNSRAVEALTRPADFTEKVTRTFAMSQGYLMAKHAYPGISDRGATIYASAITDRVIGNYYPAQRPVLFQGTFGAVLGLYQTYMTTFAQHVFRGIETKNLPALASSMLSQAGIFGMSSMPGYDSLSKFIGQYMSQDNFDLTTGTYRAIGDPMAEVMLYGLPSMIGPSLYTRGDISPRIPTQFGDLAIANTTMGVYNATAKMFNTLVNQPSMEGKLQGMMEALSLQTLSRPIARVSEIIAGESITKKGQTVSTSDQVWTPNGIFSRLLSARPMEEQVTRNALHLNSFYGAADYESRQRAVNRLRVAIRAGDMPDDLVDNVASDYLRHGGSAKGWNSVMNEIMTRTEEGTSYDLLRRLEPNSPLRLMIKDTF